MAIVSLSDYVLQRLKGDDRRIVRDRILVGFCVILNKRRRTFMVATSCKGKQVRVFFGHWPLMSADEAREIAADIIRQCRAGTYLDKPKLPTKYKSICEILPQYIQDKGLKLSSQKRYDSVMRTHFVAWYECPINELASPLFAEHCHKFVQKQTLSVIEMGRAFIGAIIRYVNAIYDLDLKSPFDKLAAAGMMNEKMQPRKRKLQEADLPAWYKAVCTLPDKQRDGLMLLAMTGCRRNEALMMKRKQVNFDTGVISIPDTKTGKPHSLPITPIMDEILKRRCEGLSDEYLLFAGISVEHLASMAERAGSPRFMLHDLRKMLATVGERLQIPDAILRRILNHTAQHSNTLYRHYVSTELSDIKKPLEQIQDALLEMMSL